MQVQIRGASIQVDAEDLHFVTAHRWRVDPGGYVRAGSGQDVLLLHRLIAGASGNEIVDHRNGDKLDQRRANLRKCTNTENLRNRKRHANNRSGYKGVYFSKGKWRAQIRCDGEKHNLGSHASPEEAYLHYCVAAAALHGEFARLK